MYKALLGPFGHPPFDLHMSSFMTRPKSGSEFRRTIVDLSWSKGYSVNDGISNKTYLGTEFQLHYPSVDTIIQILGPVASIFKVKVSRVFRHIPTDPEVCLGTLLDTEKHTI